ncbi:MAG TPA: GxxExxY protein [Alphaproteobacteria bacterium]
MKDHQDTKAPSNPEGAAMPRHLDEFGRAIVDSAFRVHSTLGPGLLESVYEECLAYELRSRGLAVQRQVSLPIAYDKLIIPSAYRIDLIVADEILVEVKAAEAMLPVHHAQLLTYLKLSKKRLGYLINFNVPLIKSGIKRVALWIILGVLVSWWSFPARHRTISLPSSYSRRASAEVCG